LHPYLNVNLFANLYLWLAYGANTLRFFQPISDFGQCSGYRYYIMFVLMCSGNRIHTYVFNVVYACFYLRFQTNEFYHCSFPHGPPSKFISYQSRKVQRSATCSTLMEKNYLLHTKCTHCLIVTLWCFSVWLFWNLSESIPLSILECLILRLRSIVIWNFNRTAVGHVAPLVLHLIIFDL